MADFITIPKQTYSTSEGAHYLGVCKSDLDKSRVTGELRGLNPPRFIKIGRSVRYKIKDLNEWLDSQPSYMTIAEETEALSQAS